MQLEESVQACIVGNRVLSEVYVYALTQGDLRRGIVRTSIVPIKAPAAGGQVFFYAD